MKILIAEDNPTARLLLVKIMKKSGHKVYEAEDGLKAWEILENDTIDILITDWVMPNMDGLSLCKKIRTRSQSLDIYTYIIVITGKNKRKDLIEVFESGADDYITKPFDPAEVRSRISTAERIIELENRHRSDKIVLINRSNDLDSKIRELNCLYGISDMLNKPGISIEEILQETVGLIRPSLHFSENSLVRIITDSGEYKTDDFKITDWRLDHDISVKNEKFGILEVYRLNKNPEIEGHFYEEEKRFIKNVANRLGSAIEQVKMEEKLKEDEHKYRTILENIEEGYFEVDIGGRFTFVNDSMCKITGFSKDEMIGMTNRLFLENTQAKKVYRVFNNVFTTEKPLLSYRHEIIRKDGTKKYVELSISLINSENGEKTGFRSIFRDITDRKEYEENLKFFKDLIDQANDAISVLDPITSGYKYFNSRACEMYGYEKEELLQKGPKDLDVALSEEKIIERMNEIEQKKSVLFEALNKRKDGTIIPLEISAKLIHQGNKPYHLIVARDITDRKQAEKEKKEYETQLIQSEKMASIGQLAAGVAHEINNPTGFVNSNLKTLGEYQHDMFNLLNEYRKYLDDIRKHSNKEDLIPCLDQFNRILEMEEKIDIDFILNDSNDLIFESQSGMERIRKIVQALKNFAHPGEDKMKFADINKNLESTLNVVWNELKYKAEVIKDYGNLPLIECIPQQLNQVFGNLMVNAAQAIEKSGKITISTKAENNHIDIIIMDNGAGIPEENISRIFDPFFTTKEIGKGTGLGLNVAYNIIKKHNGTIDVESKVGEGTKFTIRIPSSGNGSPDSAL